MAKETKGKNERTRSAVATGWLADEPAEFHFPGDVVLDVDGIPAGVEPSTTVTAVTTVRISRTELTRTGLTDKEIPNVRITD